MLAVPDDVDAERPRLLARAIIRSASGETAPFLDAHIEHLSFVRAELEHLRNRLAVGFKSRLGFPYFEEARRELIEQCVNRGAGILLKLGHAFRGLRRKAVAFEPL